MKEVPTTVRSPHASVAARRRVDARIEPPILVVEDDCEIRSAMAELLRQEAFSVVEASNGRKALEYLLMATMMPSLILLDLNMPVVSGWEVIRVLRSHLRFANVPIVLVTGEQVTTAVTNRDTVGRLSKPFSPEELLAVVRQHVVGSPMRLR